MSASSILFAQNYSIHVVSDEKTDQTETLPYQIAEGKSVEVTILKAPLATEKDTVSATLSEQQQNSLQIQLTKEAGQKMFDTTEKFKKGTDRLAVVMDGKITSVATVQSTLEKNFSIILPEELTKEELKNFEK